MARSDVYHSSQVFSLRRSHEILLRLKHDPNCDMARAIIWYTDRGAPGDISYVSGVDIVELAAYYFEVRANGAMKRIPYHRIRRIAYGERVIWKRSGDV
ncbi:MAG: DUF504 domain-containing protein [Methanomicrobiales archaeon]|nr:DUF504 domain-containing protein [Methanomicrobiales archaeon]